MEQYFEDLLAFFFPDVHRDVDFQRGYEFLSKELSEIAREGAVGQRFADNLVKVFLKDGAERWLVIHIEVQGYLDPDFARRMFIYNYRAFDRYNVDVVSLAVLADAHPAYRPRCFEVAHWDFRCRFEFPAVKLLDYRERWAELERSVNPFAVLVMAHLKALETGKRLDERFFWKVSLVKALYGRGYSREDVLRLYRFIDELLTLPDELARQFHQEIVRYEEAQKMSYITTAERIGMEKKGFNWGFNKGFNRGPNRGC